MDSLSSLLRHEQPKQHEQPKYRVFLQAFPVAMLTVYDTKMTPSRSAIIDVSHGTITLLLRDKVL